MGMVEFGVVLFALASSSFALDAPVRKIKAYPDAHRESMVRVLTARVVTADYELLRKDFLQLRAFSDEQIDGWILDHAGYLALPQAMNVATADIQSPVSYEHGDLLTAFRPEGYRRGMVFDASAPQAPGLLDGKGFGARDPRPGINSNGLMPLADAVREWVWQNVVQRVFDAHGGKFTTVRTYAVLDWGFDMKLEGGRSQAAGAVLRQAHTREHWNFNSNLPKDEALEIELLLRQYGITSAGLSEALRRQTAVSFDLINIQGRRMYGGGAAIVDFGTFVRVPAGHRFTRPLAVRENIFTSAAVLQNTVGGNRDVGVLTEVMATGEPGFLEAPVSTDAVPAALFAAAESGRLFPEYDAVSRAVAPLRTRAEVLELLTRLLGSLRLGSCENLLLAKDLKQQKP